jgi:hypothetical protein
VDVYKPILTFQNQKTTIKGTMQLYSSIKNIFHNFIHSGRTYENTDPDKYRIQILNITFGFLILRIPILIIQNALGPIGLYSFNTAINIVILTVIISLVIYLRKTYNAKALGNLLIALILIGSTISFIQENGAWHIIAGFVALPIGAFFFTGKKNGLIWSGIMLIILLTLMIIISRGIIQPNYPINSLFDLFISALVTIIVTYTFQLVIDNREKALTKSRGELSQTLDKLKQEFALRESTQLALQKQTEELTIKNDELSRMNKMMIDRELKMVQLKKENEELKAKYSA